jgi:peptide subunit release factor 1 (eRF1)
MITKTDLQRLSEFKEPAGRVLSVYLDVDQSRAVNLNRGFVSAFEANIKEIGRGFEEEYEQRDFDGCAAEVRNLLSRYEPRARGLVIFTRSTGWTWFRELNVPVETHVRWGQTAYVQQFLEALDEFQTYAIAVVDRSQGRIFTVKLGNIEKQAEIHAPGQVSHIKTTGTDHLYSQSHLQRKADEHALSHLKRVVELLEHVAQFTPFKRVVLAGSTEATSELFRLLPKAMRRQVIASAVLPANASERDILEQAMVLACRAERTEEIEKAETLITAAAKRQKAVAGLADTIQALNEKRVRELVYAEGFFTTGGICEPCHAIFRSSAMNCEFCSMPVKPVDDLIEAAVDSALAKGATIEQLRGEAAEKLKTAGGIGAFLRF